MTGEEATTWLKSAGLNVCSDQGAIKILVGETTIIGGVSFYDLALFLYPGKDGWWHLLDPDLPDPACSYSTLEFAAHSMPDYVKQKELAIAAWNGAKLGTQ